MYELFACLSRLHPVSPELKNFLTGVMKPRKIFKYRYLLQEGETNTKLWFLEKGLVRCFHQRGDREVTTWFVNEGHAIASLKSLFEQVPSKYYLQALEDSMTLSLDYPDLQYILAHYPEANLIRVKISDWYTNLLNMRLRCTSMQSPKDRYDYLKKHFPYLASRVTLEIMASYLDISKRTLIRLMHE